MFACKISAHADVISINFGQNKIFDFIDFEYPKWSHIKPNKSHQATLSWSLQDGVIVSCLGLDDDNDDDDGDDDDDDDDDGDDGASMMMNDDWWMMNEVG